MASGFSESGNFETRNESALVDQYGDVYNYDRNRENFASANDIPRFRGGHPRNAVQRGRFQRQNNYNGRVENDYYNNRHRRVHNVNGHRNPDVFHSQHNASASDGNSVHNSFSTNLTTSRGGSKRYSKNRGLVVESDVYAINPCSSDAGIAFNQPLNDLDFETQKPTSKMWNCRNKPTFSSNKRGKSGGHSSKYMSEEAPESNESRAYRGYWNDRSMPTSASGDHRGDIEPADSMKNSGRHSRGGKGRWSRNEGRKNFHHQSTKLEKPKMTLNDTHKTYENNSEEHDKTSGTFFVEGKNEERTYENQRELLEDQLRSSSYECLVCCSRIGKSAPIWNCSTCFNIFHLGCIKKWAQSSAVECPLGIVEVEGDKKFWRCPTCQNASSEVPDKYLCFCGKQRDPQFSFEAPHSCGEVCTKKRGKHCKHPCNILCHPGPCPPCVSMVHTMCGCGKKSTYVMCSSSVDLKCEEVCNRMLNCGNHTCVDVCHKGSCHPCLVEVEQKCHCGKDNRTVPCGSKESLTSSYSCRGKCEKIMDCGNHSCMMVCHQGDCEPCMLKPELVTHCACGKSDIGALFQLHNESDISPKMEVPLELSTSKKLKKKKKKNTTDQVKEDDSPEDAKWPRTSCLDPLPSCGQVCNKELQCGSEDQKHHCKRKCHNGPCQGCSETSHVRCNCGLSLIDIPCRELINKVNQGQQVKCNRRCVAKLSCGKHKCNKNCCTDEGHFCRKTCRRNLSCGLHQCEELCHTGNCGRCWFTSFEELTCRCGAEIIYPPVPCGTKRPTCQRMCTREHLCNHPVRHTCHDESECPPCVHLTEKMCLCGKELRKNVPCYLRDIRCGNPCGKVLPCGTHFCQRFCHKGPCLDENNPRCIQPCQLSRPLCNHPCLAPCHMDEPCPKTECTSMVQVTCECGRKEGQIPCTKGDNGIDNNISSRFWLSRLSDTNILNSNNRLQCDKECAIYRRNKQLAEALQITDPNLSMDAEGFVQPNYSDFLKDYAKRNAFFVSQIEHDLHQLVKDTKVLDRKDYKCHSFKIMKREMRRVVHELAECYGVETESQDEEPHRNVVAKATKGRCWLPKNTLVPTNSSSRTAPSTLSQSTTRPPPSTTLPTMGPLTALKKEPQPQSKVKSKPAIDYFDFEG